MIYTRPFVAARFIAHAGDSWTRQLALAVQVVDSFTEEPPQVSLRVRLFKEEPPQGAIRPKHLPGSIPVLNRSGFFCFEDITEAGAYTLVIEPDRATSDWYYLESTGPVWTDTFERSINLPKPDPKSPVEIATFVPKSSYPFPGNATLVRGKVTQGLSPDGTPVVVEGAIVSTTYQHEDPPGAPQSPVMVKTLTDREGEFVLFFKRLPSATQKITVGAVKGGPPALPASVKITEGMTLKGVDLNLP